MEAFNIKIPNNVNRIINILSDSGYEAYAVGGCVRDTILGRKPDDWDITTSALPTQVKGLFSRTVDTGIQHGTVTVLIGKESYEVTTYRVDGEYSDSRHPDEVKFTPSLVEDLKRRDFTINAMAYNPQSGLVDVFGGIDDLNNGIIRCVGDAAERFNEDALRILRAVRFSAQLGFEIECKTKGAVEKMAETLLNISKERIQVELNKLLLSKNPDKMRVLYQLGITKYIMPEFDLMMKTEQNSIYHNYNVGEHTIIVMQNVRPDHYLRWAALLHDVGKPEVKSTDKTGYDHFYAHGERGTTLSIQILRGLKFDNRTVDYVSRLVRVHDYKVEPDEISVRRSISKIGEDIYSYFIELRYADLMGKSERGQQGNFEKLEKIKKIYKTIIDRNDCLTLKTLNIKGADLIELGIERGEKIGTILNALLETVLEKPELNTKEKLVNYVNQHYI